MRLTRRSMRTAGALLLGLGACAQPGPQAEIGDPPAAVEPAADPVGCFGSPTVVIVVEDGAVRGLTEPSNSTPALTSGASDGDGMLAIVGGRFDGPYWLERRPDRPHEVTVADFWLDATEVTVAAYRACVDAGVCASPTSSTETKACNWSEVVGERDNHPVNCVSGLDAHRYCEWLGNRLPTELEFEWAARSRDRASKYPWGDTPPDPRSACWNQPNGADGTCEVNSHPAGASVDAVVDLAGNVREWTIPCTGEPPWIGSSAPPHGRLVVRGSDWGRADTVGLEAASHYEINADDRDAQTGFRCAKSP